MKKSTRRLVFERDNMLCVSCGSSDLTIQHRISKGMGGSKILDSPSNLLTLCLLCNERLESDAEFAALGKRFGWKLHRNRDVIPSNERCWYPADGRWWLLDDEGNRVEYEQV